MLYGEAIKTTNAFVERLYYKFGEKFAAGIITYKIHIYNQLLQKKIKN